MGAGHREKKGGCLETEGPGNEEMLLGKKVSGAQDRVSRDLHQKVTGIGDGSQKVTCYLLHF